MKEQSTPVFIVSSGRSGTAMMERLLAAHDSVDMHHEYMVHITQPLACKHAMGLINRQEVLDSLYQTIGSAIHYSEKPIWCDSSNKLSWVIEPLYSLFPDARFIHLARDGRKVASSYFNKLADECYDDKSVETLSAYLQGNSAVPPPPEKKYWWFVPPVDHPAHQAFKSYDQFERIAFHWSEINRQILDGLTHVPWNQQLFVRLEDLTTQYSAYEEFANFLDLKASEDDFNRLKRPHNVNKPVDTKLTSKQTQQFEQLADQMMGDLGYRDRPEYAVSY